MTRKRVYRCGPVEIEGLTEEQVNKLRKQPNAENLIIVYNEVQRCLDENKQHELKPFLMAQKLGIKKFKIKKAIKRIDTLLYN